MWSGIQLPHLSYWGEVWFQTLVWRGEVCKVGNTTHETICMHVYDISYFTHWNYLSPHIRCTWYISLIPTHDVETNIVFWLWCQNFIYVSPNWCFLLLLKHAACTISSLISCAWFVFGLLEAHGSIGYKMRSNPFISLKSPIP